MIVSKIMIIDDSEPDQFLTKISIEKFDSTIEILQAYDGKEALESLKDENTQPDIILLDINMPVMDGHEFLEHYSKRENQQTVVIMLTSSDQKEDKEKSIVYDCVKQYFTKPVDVKDFEALIQEGVIERK